MVVDAPDVSDVLYYVISSSVLRTVYHVSVHNLLLPLLVVFSPLEKSTYERSCSLVKSFILRSWEDVGDNRIYPLVRSTTNFVVQSKIYRFLVPPLIVYYWTRDVLHNTCTAMLSQLESYGFLFFNSCIFNDCLNLKFLFLLTIL